MPSYSSNPLSRLRTSYPRFTEERNDFYLNVPYEDREIAKRMGAKWDAEARKWFCRGSEDYGTKLALVLKFTGDVVSTERELIW